MKKHTRNLLIIIPLLPLLMANSPAPRRESYKDFEVTYLSVETLHNYNFYHLNIKNVGEGYVTTYLSLTNKVGEKSFYADVERNEIVAPFENVLIEPGFDKEVIVATKNEIPESKEVEATAYQYSVVAEDITFSGSKEVQYSLMSSNPSTNYYVYKVDAQYDGTLLESYNYTAAIKITYNGVSCVVESDEIEQLSFRTNESLDLTKLTVDEVIMIRSYDKYEYRDYYYGNGCKNFLNTVLLFLLISSIILGFGIFSAIFFPAMARRRRRKALLEQDKK